MRKREVSRVKPGDFVRCAYNLGEGEVIQVLEDYEPGKDAPIDGRYPMIQFKTSMGTQWCTYKIIRYHRPKLRAVEANG